MYPDQISKMNLNSTTFSFYERRNVLKSYYSLMSDLKEFIRAYPDIQRRYLIQASQSVIPEYDLLEFSQDNIRKGFELGVSDAKAILEKGAGFG